MVNPVQSDKPTPPTSLGDIPTLGPIRVRALQKAGFKSPRDLKKLTIADLEGVRGITPTKAAFIVNWLGQFEDAQLQQHEIVTPEQAPQAMVQWDPARERNPISAISREAARILAAIVAFSTAHTELPIRNRLASALNRLSQECLGVVLETVHVRPGETEKTMRRMRKVTEMLHGQAHKQDLDKKDQGRLADAINEAIVWISTLRMESAANPELDARNEHDV